MARMKQKIEDIHKLTQRLQEQHPTETNAFLGFLQQAESGPALDMKQKELINIGLAVAAQCEWCIAFHVEQAAAAGAS